MRYIAKQIGLLTASLVMVLGLAAVPVSAEHGMSDDSVVTTSPNSTDPTTTDGQDDTVVKSTTETETDSNSTSDRGTLQEKAHSLLSTERQTGKEHSQAIRQKMCEQRQKSIDRRTTNFAAAAQRHLDVFNKIFTKVQAFHDSKQLTVADYDALVATATAKQTAAQTAVDALKALNVQIDCTQPDPATTVATIKTAVSDARTALQAYRAAIKDVIVALKGASTSSQTTSDTTQEGN